MVKLVASGGTGPVKNETIRERISGLEIPWRLGRVCVPLYCMQNATLLSMHNSTWQPAPAATSNQLGFLRKASHSKEALLRPNALTWFGFDFGAAQQDISDPPAVAYGLRNLIQWRAPAVAAEGMVFDDLLRLRL